MKESQENLAKKAQWLVDWKARFVEDLNRAGFAGAISDMTGLQYTGIKHASPVRLSVMTPYGPTELDWLKFSPKAPAADASDRQWLSAIFANETVSRSQHDSLRRLRATPKPNIAITCR